MCWRLWTWLWVICLSKAQLGKIKVRWGSAWPFDNKNKDGLQLKIIVLHKVRGCRDCGHYSHRDAHYGYVVWIFFEFATWNWACCSLMWFVATLMQPVAVLTQPVVVLIKLRCGRFMWIDIILQLRCDAVATVALTAILWPHHVMWSVFWNHGTSIIYNFSINDLCFIQQ